MLLDLLREAFTNAMDDLPKSYYEADKLMKQLGLGYEKIDACPNDCTLYWRLDKERVQCRTCSELRWETSETDPTGDKRKIARKVLWYFPIKPRLQRLFMSSKTAAHMRWHSESRTKDGYMRHPADSLAWQTFDHKHPEFAKDPRNIRLGLASDGFNPFKTMSVAHSTWLVILMPYNLPPWMCMKQPYFMLSLLIPGPSAPGNNIDIYLQSLVADLKDLWEVGMQTYDASTKQNFQLHAALLWTISDFPGYATLSGWSTKGQLVCPVCHKFTHSRWLKNGRNPELPMQVLLQQKDERAFVDQYVKLVAQWNSEKSKIGCYVSIKSIFDSMKIVTKRVVRSMDPNTEVGRQMLGPNFDAKYKF